ncbi:MAG TPA: sugar kinase [Micrococcaceae bacterium]
MASLPPADVLTFGETMGSVRAAGLIRDGGPMDLSLAGSETNVAIGLARLGHTVRWVGRLGDDEVGQLARRTLRAENVLADLAPTDGSRPTGLMLLERRVADVSRVSYYRAGSAGSALSVQDLEPAFAAPPRLVHLTGITPALSESAAEATLWAAAKARSAGAILSLDVNYRAKLWSRQDARRVLVELARFADIVIASEDELELVLPAGGEAVPGPANAGYLSRDEAETVARLAERGVAEVVIKRGARGATAWREGVAVSVPARPVNVLDTVGAGDAFTAGYLSALLDGGAVEARLDRGTVLGAFAVSRIGDWAALPFRQDLRLLEHESGSTLR